MNEHVEEWAEAMRKANIGKVSVEPSAIVYSPYNYVYVYLTEKEHEGPHLILSDAAEHGDEGIIIGRYEHFEEMAKVGNVRTVMDLDDAIRFAKAHSLTPHGKHRG